MQNQVLNRSDHSLVHTLTELFRTTRDHKGLLEIHKVLPHNIHSTQNLQSTKSILAKAQINLKHWSQGNTVFYNPTRGDLLPTLLYCQQVIQELLTFLPHMSQQIQNDLNNSEEIHTVSTVHNLNLTESMRSQTDIRKLLCRMHDLNRI